MKVSTVLLAGPVVFLLCIHPSTAGPILAGRDLAAKCICPRIFSPVCAVDRTGRRRNTANECTAKCEGYKVVNVGLCLPVEFGATKGK